MAAKILEAAALHRMLPALEGALDPSQYAYRRDRGTEFHLTQLYDFSCRGLGERVNLPILYIYFKNICSNFAAR